MKKNILLLIILTLFFIFIFNYLFYNGTIDFFSNKTINMSVFVISMSDTVFKMAEKNIQKTLPDYVINKYDAVKGSTLDISDLVTTKAYYDIMITDKRKIHSDLPSKNAVGCYISHTNLWKNLLNSTNDYYFIFESDVNCLSYNFQNIINEYITKFPDGDILFFGIFGHNSSEIVKLDNRFFGLHAYLINKRAARILLDHAFPIEEQLDSFMSYAMLVSKQKGSPIEPLNFYYISKCIQNNQEGTSIQTKSVICNV